MEKDNIYHFHFYTRTKPDGRVYVGCTRQELCERWAKSYTFDTTDTEDKSIAVFNCTQHDADIIEAYYIMKYDAVRTGLNKNYGYAMNHWYRMPKCYTNWNDYINENYAKVYKRLENWVRENFIKS